MQIFATASMQMFAIALTKIANIIAQSEMFASEGLKLSIANTCNCKLNVTKLQMINSQ
jgi:hypothetical protein